MKAIVSTRLGFPRMIRLKEVEKPFPKDNEVLVEVHASCVNYNNRIMVDAKFLPMRLLMGRRLMPVSRIPGTNMAGRVVAVGKKVIGFKPGNDVYGDLFFAGHGCFAEYICIPENGPIVLMPANTSYEEAAAVPEAGLVALSGLRDYGNIKKSVDLQRFRWHWHFCRADSKILWRRSYSGMQR